MTSKWQINLKQYFKKSWQKAWKNLSAGKTKYSDLLIGVKEKK